MSIAVVTIVHGRHDHLRAQQRSLLSGDVVPDLHVVVAMDDPSVPLSPSLPTERVTVAREPLGLPLARARNQGARTALDAGADVLVFLDVDCLAGPGLVDAYRGLAAVRRDTVWSGPVTYLAPPPTAGYDLGALPDDPHRARRDVGDELPPDLFWSLSFACHRDAWERVGGFCEEYVGYGGEDTDFGHLATARGVRLGWTDAARAYHQWHPTSDPPVQHLDDILRNGRVFARRWGRWPMTGWLHAFAERGLVVQRDGHWVATGRRSGAGPRRAAR